MPIVDARRVRIDSLVVFAVVTHSGELPFFHFLRVGSRRIEDRQWRERVAVKVGLELGFLSPLVLVAGRREPGKIFGRSVM